jgi:hypothetical protein
MFVNFFSISSPVNRIAAIQVTDAKRKQLHRANRDAGMFDVRDLEFRSMAQCRYLEDKSLRHIYIYHYSQDTRAIWALFIPAGRKAHVWVLNRVRTEGIPNLSSLYDTQRNRLYVALRCSTFKHYQFFIFPNNIKTLA